jgi:drug/metabolite transporter (DMT)-like permease
LKTSAPASAELPSNLDMSFWTGMATVSLCMLFGANAVAIKVSLGGLGVFTTAGIRFGLAAVVLALWAAATGRSFRIPNGYGHHLVITALIFTVQLSLFYLGLSKTNASRGALLANLQPFFTLFLAHFFIQGDRLDFRKLAGIILGFGGVAFVFWETSGVSADLKTGDAIILCATFIWACNAVYVKRIIHAFQPFQITFYPMLIAVPLFFVEAFIWDPAMVTELSTEVLAALFYQVFVTASFGFVLWNMLLKKHGAVALHSFLFIMPISGVVFGGLLLGEPITPKLIVALLMITVGILTVHLRPNRRWISFFSNPTSP